VTLSTFSLLNGGGVHAKTPLGFEGGNLYTCMVLLTYMCDAFLPGCAVTALPDFVASLHQNQVVSPARETFMQLRSYPNRPGDTESAQRSLALVFQLVSKAAHGICDRVVRLKVSRGHNSDGPIRGACNWGYPACVDCVTSYTVRVLLMVAGDDTYMPTYNCYNRQRALRVLNHARH
jgi:hypothetical protein